MLKFGKTNSLATRLNQYNAAYPPRLKGKFLHTFLCTNMTSAEEAIKQCTQRWRAPPRQEWLEISVDQLLTLFNTILQKQHVGKTLVYSLKLNWRSLQNPQRQTVDDEWKEPLLPVVYKQGLPFIHFKAISELLSLPPIARMTHLAHPQTAQTTYKKSQIPKVKKQTSPAVLRALDIIPPLPRGLTYLPCPALEHKWRENQVALSIGEKRTCPLINPSVILQENLPGITVAVYISPTSACTPDVKHMHNSQNFHNSHPNSPIATTNLSSACVDLSPPGGILPTLNPASTGDSSNVSSMPLKIYAATQRHGLKKRKLFCSNTIKEAEQWKREESLKLQSQIDSVYQTWGIPKMKGIMWDGLRRMWKVSCQKQQKCFKVNSRVTNGPIEGVYYPAQFVPCGKMARATGSRRYKKKFRDSPEHKIDCAEGFHDEFSAWHAAVVWRENLLSASRNRVR